MTFVNLCSTPSVLSRTCKVHCNPLPNVGESVDLRYIATLYCSAHQNMSRGRGRLYGQNPRSRTVSASPQSASARPTGHNQLAAHRTQSRPDRTQSAMTPVSRGILSAVSA